MLITELQEIKNSIIRSNQLYMNNHPLELDKTVSESINCYAYSLGIIYTNPKATIFVPGFTQGTRYKYGNCRDLQRKVCMDLNNLGIPFKKLNLNKTAIPLENEYLVKLFYSNRSRFTKSRDFHFIRQDPISKKWFHKLGWTKQPENLNSEIDNCGAEPNIFLVRDSLGQTLLEYKPICYFVLTEKAIL